MQHSADSARWRVVRRSVARVSLKAFLLSLEVNHSSCHTTVYVIDFRSEIRHTTLQHTNKLLLQVISQLLVTIASAFNLTLKAEIQ